jgi:hypothetical protein
MTDHSDWKPGLTHIGTQKQLFLDDYMVESVKNAVFELNPAVKYRDNPVIGRDRPWEGNDLHYASVLYDEQEQLFRMWYQNCHFTNDVRVPKKTVPTVPGKTGVRMLYAESKDGFHWERPELGLVEFEGSKANNIVGDENWPKFKGGVFIDPMEEDPAKRFKALAQVKKEEEGDGDLDRDLTERASEDTDKRFVWNLYTSGDAFNWTPYPGNPVIDRPQSIWGPTAMIGWDPIRKVYAAHMENCINKHAVFGPHLCPPAKRLIGRAESPDLIHWSEPETILIPDKDDPPDLEFYSMWATTYENFYIGMLWNFRKTNTTILPQLAFSRDGIRYDRRYRQPFIQAGDEGAFDSSTVYALQPIVHDDKIFIYYSGQNYRASEQIDILLDEFGEDGPKGQIGLAVVPLDGFVSIDSGHHEYGELVTRSFVFEGNALQVNTRAAWLGWSTGLPELKVEILAADHTPLPGFRFDEADNIAETGFANTVTWEGRADVSALAGKPVKLKFYSKNLKLFAYQFVK